MISPGMDATGLTRHGTDGMMRNSRPNEAAPPRFGAFISWMVRLFGQDAGIVFPGRSSETLSHPTVLCSLRQDRMIHLDLRAERCHRAGASVARNAGRFGPTEDEGTMTTIIPTQPFSEQMAIRDYRQRLVVYVVWHRDFDRGTELARFFYDHLMRDSQQPIARGLGIPVYFRSSPASADSAVPRRSARRG